MTAALISALEKASEGSRELDAEIALAVGWTQEKRGRELKKWWGSPPGSQYDWMRQSGPPRFSTSLDAGLPGEDIYRVERVESPTERWWKAYQGQCIGQGKTEALARRIAALKSRRPA